MKIKINKLLPLAVSGCVLVGTLSGCSIQDKAGDFFLTEYEKRDRDRYGDTVDEETIVYDDPTITSRTTTSIESTVQDTNDRRSEYDESQFDYIAPEEEGEIKTSDDYYYIDENTFTSELGEKTGANIYLTNEVTPVLAKRVTSKYNRYTNEVIEYSEEYFVGDNLVYKYDYENFKEYRNRETNDIYYFRLYEEVPQKILNNCEYVGLSKIESKKNTIVEGSNTTIFERKDDYLNRVSVFSSVNVSRDEFFHFLENEEEFVRNYFQYRPYDYNEAVGLQDPNREYRYVYATDLDVNGNVIDGENLYICDNETFYGVGYNNDTQSVYTEGTYSDPIDYGYSYQ